MNNTITATISPNGPPTDMLDGSRLGGFGYGVGVSVGILLLITTITLASYFCTRANTPGLAPANAFQRRRTGEAAVAAADLEAGIDETTLRSYPQMRYDEAKLQDAKATTAAACCSICLTDYKDADVLRQLPECRHMFHLKCVDPWLRSHPTCPVCRTSPAPSPTPTPLAEVMPLRQQPT